MDLVAGAGGIFGGLAVGLAGGMTGDGTAGGGGINGIMMAASGKFGGMGPGGGMGQHVKANIDSLPDKVNNLLNRRMCRVVMYSGAKKRLGGTRLHNLSTWLCVGPVLQDLPAFSSTFPNSIHNAKTVVPGQRGSIL